MSQKQVKSFRRISQKSVTRKTKTVIYTYVERLCRQPLWVRIAYSWRIIRGRHPHTGEKIR